eukprot:scaffold8520_cov248-Pinguiococcus_pyrenoidosus.AAC.5
MHRPRAPRGSAAPMAAAKTDAYGPRRAPATPSHWAAAPDSSTALPVVHFAGLRSGAAPLRWSAAPPRAHTASPASARGLLAFRGTSCATSDLRATLYAPGSVRNGVQPQGSSTHGMYFAQDLHETASDHSSNYTSHEESEPSDALFQRHSKAEHSALEPALLAPAAPGFCHPPLFVPVQLQQLLEPGASARPSSAQHALGVVATSRGGQTDSAYQERRELPPWTVRTSCVARRRFACGQLIDLRCDGQVDYLRAQLVSSGPQDLRQGLAVHLSSCTDQEQGPDAQARAEVLRDAEGTWSSAAFCRVGTRVDKEDDVQLSCICFVLDLEEERASGKQHLHRGGSQAQADDQAPHGSGATEGGCRRA